MVVAGFWSKGDRQLCSSLKAPDQLHNWGASLHGDPCVDKHAGNNLGVNTI